MLLAARAIAAVENPQDVFVVASRSVQTKENLLKGCIVVLKAVLRVCFGASWIRILK